MTDTVYTPSEMLDRVEARTASLRRELESIEAEIEAASGDYVERRRLALLYVTCAGRIAALFDSL